VAVPPVNVRNSAGNDLTHWEDHLLQVQSNENQNPWLDSLFSPMVKSLEVQTGMGVDLVQLHLELYVIL